jgi:membrane-bound metal-dependent hydrolase YbcI (DUF457 family)
MDPVSHLAFGRTLIALARPEQQRGGMITAAVLGSLAPDVDAAMMPFGWDRYLRVHEIGTHTLAGALVCAVGTAWLVRLLRRDAGAAPLAAAALLGATGHLFLDIVSGARLRPLWPFSGRYVTAPLVGMAEPILLGGLLLTLALLWTCRGRRQRAAATAAVIGVGVFLGLKAALAMMAVAAYEATPGVIAGPPEARVVEARWGTMRQWTVYDRTRDEVRIWELTAGEPHAALTLRWPRTPPSGLPRASTSFSTVRNFLRVHELSLVTTIPMADGHAAVLWSDIRFCRDARGASSTDELPVAVLPEGGGLSCALWFGGEYDAGGKPVREIVKIGTITQTR